MNIAEVIIDFENEDANDLPVPAWSDASDQMGLLNWNPENKSEDDLFEAYLNKTGLFGIHCVLGQSGFDLKISVYQIFEVQRRPEQVETRVDHPDGSYEISEKPAFDFDDRYFIKDKALVKQESINLKTVFGKDWNHYLSLISDMRNGNLSRIHAAEMMRGSAHNALADKLGEKLQSIGFAIDTGIYSPLRGFISMLVEYHHEYGRVSAHNKIGMEPPKAEPFKP